MNFKRFAIPMALTGFLLTTACSYTTQGSSGSDYLARYSQPQYAKAKAATDTADVDARVKDIAMIEPHLEFPARIGIARIEHGRLSTIPADEGEAWVNAAKKLGEGYGEFVPVSPLIAEMVATPTSGTTQAARIVSTIRQGAARQHLDYVLVYEVGVSRRDKANVLSLADLTVVGMFVIPSRSINVEATASGILLDVRNGYPYATLTAHSEKKGLSRLVSSGSTTHEYAKTAQGRAVVKLSSEFEAAMSDLMKMASEAKKPDPSAS